MENNRDRVDDIVKLINDRRDTIETIEFIRKTVDEFYEKESAAS